MTPFQLTCFISVERHLSFTKAAEDCHVAQATISRQIDMLEKEIGCKLFIRDSHGVKVTAAGATLGQYAPVFLEYQRTIAEQVRNASSSTQKILRIGVGPYEHLLLRRPLQVFHAQHPEVRINVNTYTYHVLLTRYRNGVLDMALCNDLSAAHMTHYNSHEIGQFHWQVAATEDSPFWQLPPCQQQVLHGQTLITLINDQFNGVRDYCFRRFINIQMLETNFLTTMLEQVQAGIGIALLPPFARPMLPPGVVMKDVLQDPYAKRIFAMVSPTLDRDMADLMIRLIRDSSSEASGTKQSDSI